MKPMSGDNKPLDYKFYGIGRRYENITLATLDTSGEAYQAILDYSANITQKINNGLGLILKGPVGTGKTCAAIAVMREALANKRSAYFISMVSLLDKLLTLRDKEELYAFEQRLRTTPLLVLDDLGGEYRGKSDESWTRRKIASVIADRYDSKLSTIITTNLTVEQLKVEYDERMIDRLRSTNRLITLGGASLRHPEWR